MLDTLVARRGELDWKRVDAFHMDEYLGLAPGAPQLFAEWLRARVWDAVRPGNVHALDGSAADAAAECACAFFACGGGWVDPTPRIAVAGADTDE